MSEVKDKTRRKRLLTVGDCMRMKSKSLPMCEQWTDVLGEVDRGGSILIYGMPKNGKTDFAMQLCKYLTRFGKSMYVSYEEKPNKTSYKNLLLRNQMTEVEGKFYTNYAEPINDLVDRLMILRSPDFIIIDSVQRSGLTLDEYDKLIETFPEKLFIFVSHVDESKRPEGTTARNIRRYSDVFLFVEGFMAYPVGRNGGGKPFVIWEEGAARIGSN